MTNEKGTCCICKCSLAIETGAWCSTCFDARNMHTEVGPTMEVDMDRVRELVKKVLRDNFACLGRLTDDALELHTLLGIEVRYGE